MSFVVAMKDTFWADFHRLNKDLQKRTTQAMVELEKDAITPHGDVIKKLRHHQKLWRYRLGDYRMVYAAYPENNLVQILAIGPRGEIYDRLGYQPDLEGYEHYSTAFEQALDPNQETPVEWWQQAQRWQKDKPKLDSSNTLSYRLTPQQLTEWRIPPQYHERLSRCETEDQLLTSDVPQEIMLHLINCLIPGDAIAVTQSPNRLVGNPKTIIETPQQDWINFVLLLDEDQKRLVDFSLNGQTLVKGGPGSGKSTVALYRVRALSERGSGQLLKTRILFTTYTNALIEASRQLLDRLLEDIPHGPAERVQLDISTLDKIAMRLVNQKSSSQVVMADAEDLRYSITHARTIFRQIEGNPVERMMVNRAVETIRDDYLQEEFEWVIEGRGITELQEYIKTDRSGRGYAFDLRMRTAIWQLYNHSREFIKNMNKLTWGQLRQQALEIAMQLPADDHWDYVLIDEAQDLTPVALSLAMELCRTPVGLFLTADACQSLYNKGFAWKNVHENLRVAGRTRLLKRNYRTTRQITRAAASLLSEDGSADPEALDQFYVHTGPPPQAYRATDETAMFLWLAERIQTCARELHLPVGSAAVLAPTNDLAKHAAQRLTDLGVPTDYMTGKDLNLITAHAKALTIHSSKGLEFPIVAIPYLEEGQLPRVIPDRRADDLEKHLSHERRVLFVGCTRAMRRLIVAYRGFSASRFVETLDPQLWELSST